MRYYAKTAKRRPALLKLIRAGHAPKEAAEIVGIDPSCVNRWLRAGDPELTELVARAKLAEAITELRSVGIAVEVVEARAA